MNKRALPITTGAMMIAIFAVMLLLDRQTGGLFQELIVYVLPIPMVAYSVRYGVKTSLPVLASMCLVSIFFGSFYTIFFSCSQSLIGLIFGSMMRQKRDMNQILFTVMLLSVLCNVLNLLFNAFLFGYDLTADAAELQTIMTEAMNRTGQAQALPEMLLNGSIWKQMIIVSMVFSGIMHGFIMFQLSLIILRRLKFPVERPRPIYGYFPPRILGLASLALFFVYNASLAGAFPDEKTQNILQIFGLCGYMYLLVFGMLGVCLFVRVYLPKARFLGPLLAVLSIFIMPFALLLMGVFYSSTSYHAVLLQRLAEQSSAEQPHR